MKHHSTTQHLRSFSIKMAVFFLLFSFCFTSVHATVHTVSNRSEMDADFTQITDAIAAASAGDTIYVHGSQTTYSNFTVDKKLHIIGPGYYLGDMPAENGIYETEPHMAVVSTATFNAGAEYSVIEGMRLTVLGVGCDDLTVRKNFISEDLKFTEHVDSCFIYNNMLLGPHHNNSIIFSSSAANNITNIFMVNNLVRGRVDLNTPGSDKTTNLFFNNTVVSAGATCTVTAVTAMYNIFADDQVVTSSANPAIFKENIFADAAPPIQAPASDGNVAGVNMNDVFVNLSATPFEKAWYDQKAAPNPATTNCLGGGGTGCGMTLGPNPHYVLSSIPEMPILYHLTSDGFPDTNGDINVTVKAKSY